MLKQDIGNGDRVTYPCRRVGFPVLFAQIPTVPDVRSSRNMIAVFGNTLRLLCAAMSAPRLIGLSALNRSAGVDRHHADINDVLGHELAELVIPLSELGNPADGPHPFVRHYATLRVEVSRHGHGTLPPE